MKKLKDINLLDVGNKITIVGGLWQGNGETLLCFFPEYQTDKYTAIDMETLDMDEDEWKKFLEQGDLAKTQVDSVMGKAIVRKCERQIDANIMWKCFQRDNYTCRYCGITGVPLTVDHLVLWEEGGPTIEKNLLTACKKCNRTRGNMPYKDWLQCDYYKKNTVKLPLYVLVHNDELALHLHEIKKVLHKRIR